jgi:F-type H+-transporting ATPase subunit epsilon
MFTGEMVRGSLIVAGKLQVDLVSVDERVWSGEADMVIVRTTEGELGVLPGHAPLLGQLVDPSRVRIKRPEGELAYDISGGFFSIRSNEVSVLTESCRPARQAATQ